MAIKRPSGLGRGLGSLIPTKEMEAASSGSAKSAVLETGTVHGVSEMGVMEIPISKITANPDQPRVAFRHSELEDLTNSIREHGIIQPLTVSPKSDGSYELIAGERRLRASKMAGLKNVPVIIRKTEGQERLILALIENIQREDLNPVEEAVAYDRMAKEFKMTQDEISKKVGKARSTVANTMRLLELPAEIREAIAEGAMAAGTARAILSIKDDEGRIAFFHKMMEKGMTTRQAETTAGKKTGKTRKRKDPVVSAAEERIRNCLGTRIEIKKKGSKGSIVIGFYSEDEFDKLVTKLEKCK